MLLELKNVSKSFGGLRALQNVSLTVERGQIYGLIGPNGSGKTTLLNCVSGFLRPDAGQILFDGRPIQGLPPDDVARGGLCRTFQLTLNPTRMTVMENMLLGGRAQLGERLLNAVGRAAAVRRQEAANEERARELLSLVKLDRHVNEYAGSLSGGQKKLLALAQILMADPKLILLDEPVAGVNPKLIEDIIEIVLRLRDDGRNFLIIEHNMRAVRDLCDEVCVLDAGQVLAIGEPHETLAREDVLHAYLGSGAAAAEEEEA
ncbi:MAG TPA: ABC transporter ATP-binding protein [Gammaproteobacteria bacterium]|nr:ABC transporter ATP-binding protein [Gammaproteobacteria bacterium]